MSLESERLELLLTVEGLVVWRPAFVKSQASFRGVLDSHPFSSRMHATRSPTNVSSSRAVYSESATLFLSDSTRMSGSGAQPEFHVGMTQLMPSATFNFRGQLKNIIYSAIED